MKSMTCFVLYALPLAYGSYANFSSWYCPSVMVETTVVVVVVTRSSILPALTGCKHTIATFVSSFARLCKCYMVNSAGSVKL